MPDTKVRTAEEATGHYTLNELAMFYLLGRIRAQQDEEQGIEREAEEACIFTGDALEAFVNGYQWQTLGRVPERAQQILPFMDESFAPVMWSYSGRPAVDRRTINWCLEDAQTLLLEPEHEGGGICHEVIEGPHECADGLLVLTHSTWFLLSASRQVEHKPPEPATVQELKDRALQLGMELTSIISEEWMTQAWEAGMIPKEALQPGAFYAGHCRNAEVALWDGRGFRYFRSKFGGYCEEQALYPAAGARADVFIPMGVVGV